MIIVIIINKRLSTLDFNKFFGAVQFHSSKFEKKKWPKELNSPKQVNYITENISIHMYVSSRERDLL